MPAERVLMRQAREIIRLKFSASLPTREIARRLGLAPSTVRETLSRLEGAGLSWPLPEGIGDAELEAALYANRRSKQGHRRHAEPDWPAVHRELKRKHVTLLIVWDEYVAANPGGYSYSRFCELLKGDLAIRPVFHQDEKRIEAHIFIAFLAYCLQITLTRRLHSLAPGLTARSALAKFAAVQMIDVHLPTTDGREIILTRTTEPEPDLRLLIDRLKLQLPAQPPPKITAAKPPAQHLL